jgi:hypothetical protein
MGTVEAAREEEALRAILRGDSCTTMGALLTLAMLMGMVATLMARALLTALGMLPPIAAAVLAVCGVSARTFRSRSLSIRAESAIPWSRMHLRKSSLASCFC